MLGFVASGMTVVNVVIVVVVVQVGSTLGRVHIIRRESINN